MKTPLWALGALGFLALETCLLGCSPYLDPLPDTPENLRLGVVIYSLKENAKAAPWVSLERARKAVEEASLIWEKSCGISFVPMYQFEIDAEKLDVDYRATNNWEIYMLQRDFEQDHYIGVVFAAELQRHEGEWIGGTAQGPSALGGQQAVAMAQASRNILAHELGHYMNLPHVGGNPYALMFPGDYGDDIDRTIAPDQCAIAKKNILEHSSLRGHCRPDSKDPVLSQEQCPAPEEID